MHNLSSFDSVFILSPIAKIEGFIKVKPIIKDKRIIKIDMIFDKYGKRITFMDSLQILPSSLDKLAECFKVDNKMLFPHKFVNDYPIDYKGTYPTPNYFYHPDPLKKPREYEIFLSKYNKIVFSYNGKEWNLKDELIKYCNNDVIILYRIIDRFTNEIFNRFKVDPFKYPTLASLAFAIYRTKYMVDENIPILTGRVYDDIKKAYYGGIVEVYKPYAENIKSYDVNSLYPFSMSTKPVPVGNPIYFEGDLSYLEDKNLIGFVYASIEAPTNLHKPLLPKRHRLESGIVTTIYPVGT